MKKVEDIKHIWSIICSQSTIDSETNNLTLVNVIEKITVNVLPADIDKMKADGAKGFMLPAQLEVTSFFKKQDEKKVGVFDMRVRMTNPVGETMITSLPQKIGLKEGVKNIRIRNRFAGIPVEKTGEYSFVVDLKDISETEYAEVGRIPLDVIVNTNVVARTVGK